MTPSSSLLLEAPDAPSVDPPQPRPNRINRRRVVRATVAIPLRFALFLFLPAGTFAWAMGWIFVLVSLAEMAVRLGCLWRVNPDVLIARSHYHVETKRWDKFLLCVYLPATLAILVVSGLDGGRFHWFPVPWPVCALGYALLLFGFVFVTWAEAVNKFFEQTVRIQAERGQRAIDRGPYAIVRHPGYVGFSLVSLGTPLALGSLWALIPAAISVLVLSLRANWEDQTLQQELAGYREYAERVRYRLIRGVW